MFATGHITFFFYTLHKFHLHKVCCQYSSQRLAKISLSPRIQMLCDTLGHRQERKGHTWNFRAPIEISAHSSSSKDSGALTTMLARKRRINSSISNGSFNLSHSVDRAKEKIKLLTNFVLDICAVRICWLI